MSKILRLINDEKKNLVVSVTKGCFTDYEAGNTPCAITDNAICSTGIDSCENYDYAACSTGAVDDCRNWDNSACLEKHLDVCSNQDNSYCAEAEKYDFEG